MGSNPDQVVGEECRKANLDTVLGGGGQKPRPEGGQNPVIGGRNHVEGPLAVRNPPHGIIGVWLL
jgi:hypothetical protein